MTQQQIGRYRIISEIDQGSFAVVFKAFDTLLERDVAVKVMRPLLMSDPDFVTRFRREAKAIARLEHAHIVPIYDYGEYEGRLFLVMKLLQGSMATLLEQGPIAWEEAVVLIQQAAAGLDFAHQSGMIHRDVKPENILLDENSQAVLADFGVVRAMEKSTITVSMSGGILGTPAYMAPEIWNDQVVTPATDVYALACVLYEMVIGQKLFDASTPAATMKLHFRDPQLPSIWPDGVPPGLNEVLSQALSKNPADRIQTAGELAVMLAALAVDPLADQYMALQTALTAENWSDAIALAEAILNQDAAYKDTADLLQEAIKGQVAAQRITQTGQWRDEVEQAVADGDRQRALTAWQRWQQIAPNDVVLKMMYQKIQSIPQPAEAAQEDEDRSVSVGQRLPVWVWGIAGVLLLVLLWWSGSHFSGANGTLSIEDSATISARNTSLAGNIVGMATATATANRMTEPTPSSTPTSRNTMTPTAASLDIPTPSSTYTRTPTSTPTPTPTPTPTSTVTNIPVPSITPAFLSPTPAPVQVSDMSGDFIQLISFSPSSGTAVDMGDKIVIHVRYQNLTYPEGQTVARWRMVRFEEPDCSWGFIGYQGGASRYITDPPRGENVGEFEVEVTLGSYIANFGDDNIKAISFQLWLSHGPTRLAEDNDYESRCFPLTFRNN